MFSKTFWMDATERTVRTFVQAFAASLVVTGLDDWQQALYVGAGAGVLAVASAIAGSQIGTKGTASVIEGGTSK